VPFGAGAAATLISGGGFGVNLRLIGVALLACASVVVAALGIGGGEKRVEQETAKSGLATLEAPSGEGDALPSQVVATLAASVHYEFTPQDFRRARRALANQPAWLLPASEGEVCLVRVVYPRVQTDLEPLIVPNCASRAAIEAGELVEVESLSGSAARAKARVVGVVPNGVTAVDVESTEVDLASTEHRVTRVPVMRNAFEAIVGDPARAWFVRRVGDHSSVERFALAGIPGNGVTRPPVPVRREVF
jgi:hypothetical protein